MSAKANGVERGRRTDGRHRTRPRRSARVRLVVGAVLACAAIGGWFAWRALIGSGPAPAPPIALGTEGLADMSERLEGHVEHLAGKIGERHFAHPAALEEAAAYIERSFDGFGFKVRNQPFVAARVEVRNIEVEIAGDTRPDEIVVVGAHYDTASGTPGANDNGSGVAALIELARFFKVSSANAPPTRTLRFVAFVNEEPPFFQSSNMGSAVYAERCAERQESIVAMLSLETMGWYSDEPESQTYPSPALRAIYPGEGNFIGFIGNTGSAELITKSVSLFRAASSFPCEGAAMPGVVEMAGWSDHWAFWQIGAPAFMVTDTAPLRYPHYHEAEDTPDKVDFARLALVVEGLRAVITGIANDDAP